MKNKTNSDSAQQRAVIYVRVSSAEQVDGGSLVTQERICREFAAREGYEVVTVFIEEGESAKTTNRTKLQEMNGFVANKKNSIDVVIAYKVDRLSRSTEDYSMLRAAFKRVGVTFISATEQFDASPSGRFMENTLANVAEFDNNMRRERVVTGMTEAVREGRWIWTAPTGYDNGIVYGKSNIVPNPVMAPLIKTAFELMATGMYATEDVRKLIEAEGLRTKQGKPVAPSHFPKILRDRRYYGEIDQFGEIHEATYESIISVELFELVQQVLKGKGKKSPQKYTLDSSDFPLRRLIVNNHSAKLTGSYSGGRKGVKYPFYRMGQNGKSLPRESFEDAFAAFMDTYSLDESLRARLRAEVRKEFGISTSDREKKAAYREKRLKELKELQSALVEKNLNGVIPDEVLKEELARLRQEQGALQAESAAEAQSTFNVEGALALADDFLAAPGSYWRHATATSRLDLPRFQFPFGVFINENGFGATEIVSVFKLKSELLNEDSSRVLSDGIEPSLPAPQAGGLSIDRREQYILSQESSKA